MPQFDVYANPSAKTRSRVPYIIVLQHDRVSETAMVVVAPLAELFDTRNRSRLLPTVKVLGKPFTLLTPDLAPVPRTLLSQFITNVTPDRARIIAALDLLFAGS